MNGFIEVTNDRGEKIYLNAHKVECIIQHNSGTTIYFSARQHGRIYAEQSYDTVKRMLEDVKG